MSVTPRLELRQSQSLVMTPQLQQAIKLLQLSQHELRDVINAEIEQNPLLELESEGDLFNPDRSQEQNLGQNDAFHQGHDTDPSLYDKNDRSAQFSGDQVLNLATEISLNGENGLGQYAPNQYDESEDGRGVSPHNGSDADSDTKSTQISPSDYGRNYESGSEKFDKNSLTAPMNENLSDQLPEQTTLRDHIWQQIGGDLHHPTDRLIADHFIDALDENGYCRLEPLDLATQLSCDVVQAEAVLALLKTCDPTGIFAASLAECLVLQLAENDELDPITQVILAHLDLVARHDWRPLARICGIDEDELPPYIALIRAQNPRPASGFQSESLNNSLIPDVLVTQTHEGIYAIELNPLAMPRVLVNQRYYAEIQKSGMTAGERAFMTEKYQAASFLVRALEQRATSLLKVATAIVSQQEAFFAIGMGGFKPMTMADIAAETGLSESTVSRVTNQKYMLTPRGLFELKYFFTAAIRASDGGDAVAAHTVRHRIKNLIEGESPDQILSDDDMVAILTQEGIKVARRTVAKYREAMKIKPSSLRKREKSSPM
ncbi:MAG: RNA polymerase factor sigma-54 [Alphaproteobacteria bacterium]|nr:RNA polymerase factor sigma-54 [Alphaproteobacteria bacterium]